MSIVSENIKYLRNLNRLTQEQFSNRIGIKRSLLGAYEEARANPPLDKLKLIATSFGVSVDALIKQDIRRMRTTPDITIGFEQPVVAPPARKMSDILEDYQTRVSQVPVIPQPSPSVFREERVVAPVEHIPPVFEEKREPIPSQPRPVTHTPSPPSSVAFATVSFVSKTMLDSYLVRWNDIQFTNQLPQFYFPGLSQGNYRCFEQVEDFTVVGAQVICSRLTDLYQIIDGRTYVLVTKPYGVIFRRVFSQLKTKGSLLMSSDLENVPTREMPSQDILEIWEVKGYFSAQLPAPPISLGKLTGLIQDVQSEIERIKKNHILPS
ncbi:MAG: helix-turn-helix domain-containing protein [Spirosomataceae bacterium]